ncbi:quinol dehydrogenase ferredoxin subunit NapH [Thiocystis violascens]|uniref:Ferredoxin-type protein, NapH/MauN family n=1 Tax=Thiocystis violascens (strain ATCC 17096 / DSM 198 / 6111) TaxID=765911 RepID=I3YGD8_THIV6|nr:quinol dehydrogenase ferredoxin subunit NapH [Thiocystis violascens]AFL76056.1 ferredoxin-type protein, NapH/MauN family [Thiocystis violascens DSM 198]
MNAGMDYPGQIAIAEQGWLKAHQWLLLRRLSQLGILALFLAGPVAGVWIVTGNLSASMTLDVLPLTDPLLLTQSSLSGTLPTLSGLIGALIVLAFYALVGGRVFCAWVCPVNLVTDLAAWTGRCFDIRPSGKLSRSLRYWLLGLILLFPLLTGVMVWEFVNPVSMTHRGLIFGGLWGLGWAWMLLLCIFLYDLLMVRRGWCGHLCPVGAFYGLLGSRALVRVAADGRERCDDCMDCFAVCPEPQVIKPALKGAAKGLGPLIGDIHCTNCGRCIDVCSKDVFRFTLGRGRPPPDREGTPPLMRLNPRIPLFDPSPPANRPGGREE